MSTPRRRPSTGEREALRSEAEQQPMMAALRRQAERQFRTERRVQPPAAPPPGSEADAQRLLHELQVHQIELELQNTELQAARDRTDTLLEKYTDLYDFAPVGYFSLDARGVILEANLTGAALLGVERARLIQRRFQLFLAPVSRTVLSAFLEGVFARPGKQICEALLLKPGGTAFWADLQAVSAISANAARNWCRVAVSDTTALKRAEEAQRRAEALALANRELTEEIARRKIVEEALRQSEAHQSRSLAEARQMQAQLRHLSHQLLQAQEEERKRISRELHDEIAQTLVGIHVHLENLGREAAANPAGLKQKIARTQGLVAKSVQLVHQFAQELRPPLLDDLGLIATLHAYMKDFTQRSGVRVRFTAFAGVDQLNSAHRIVLYRVVQSALTNVAQHAQASQVEVVIEKLPTGLGLAIKDNGKAFEVDRVLHATNFKRLGLLGMRERIEMVGGNFTIASAPGQGTTIRAHLPLGRASKRKQPR